MVKHIVLWKLKPEYKNRTEEMIRALYEMKGKISEIVDIEAGVDFVQSERSYDLAVVVTLNDRAALKAYGDHPDHQPVKELIGAAKESGIAVDFEL
jgi:hypothetical protein